MFAGIAESRGGVICALPTRLRWCPLTNILAKAEVRDI